MGDAVEIADLKVLYRILNRQKSFRSMPDARHLDQPPLPEGEGIEWGMLWRYADLKVLYRIHNRQKSFRSMDDAKHLDQPALPLGEGTEWGMLWRSPT